MDIKGEFPLQNLKFLAELNRARPLSEYHFVFDLDSTVFDVTPRTQAIFEDFCRSHSSLEIPELKFEHADWGIRQAFTRLGISTSEPLFQNFHRFWQRKFFSSEYLHCDVPYPSSIEFIDYIFRLGTTVSYLTGRDAEHMQNGTINCLRNFSLPLKSDFSNLKMKPQKAWGEDEDFKARELQMMLQQWRRPIVFFENEPVIIDLVRKELPEVAIVYTDTVHSGQSEVADDIYRLRSWKQELEQMKLQVPLLP